MPSVRYVLNSTSVLYSYNVYHWRLSRGTYDSLAKYLLRVPTNMKRVFVERGLIQGNDIEMILIED